MNRLASLASLLLSLLTLGGCGSSSSGSASSGKPPAASATQVEAAMRTEAQMSAGAANFPQLSGAAEIQCKEASGQSGRPDFACTFTSSDGKPSAGTWEIYHGRLARVTEGGGSAAPPDSPAAATALSSAVVAARAGGASTCTQILKQKTPFGDITYQRGSFAFVCSLVDSNGTPVQVNGGNVRELWEWNADGSVSKETVDLTPPSDEVLAGSLGVSPAAYVKSICQAVGPFEKDVQSRSSSLNLAAVKSAAEGKQALQDFLDAVAADTDTALNRLKAAGSPSVSNGKEIAAAIVGAFTQLRTALGQAVTSAASLPTTSPTAFKTAANTLGTNVRKSMSGIGSSLSGLKSPALEHAAKKEPSCQNLGA